MDADNTRKIRDVLDRNRVVAASFELTSSQWDDVYDAFDVADSKGVLKKVRKESTKELLNRSIRSDDRDAHAVVIVGWGRDSKGHSYYLIKNSWGTDGDHGYFRVATRALDWYDMYYITLSN